ncbi:hypothetical protein I4U23_001199 [Adineta vaga]|nr:hypothetical protein I4U23_001199 [Adineta vaga]
MRYSAAYLLAVLGGNPSPQVIDIAKILGSVGIDCDEKRAQQVIDACQGRNLEDIIADGMKKIDESILTSTDSVHISKENDLPGISQVQSADNKSFDTSDDPFYDSDPEPNTIVYIILFFDANERETRQIISYCMNEFTSKFDIKIDNSFSKFTFADLSKENITSEQLYQWHASIDIIERYQSYLDQSYFETLANEVIYNCTLPRFGDLCQYEYVYYYSFFSSLEDMIEIYYGNYNYNPSNLSCYIHMQCDRGLPLACLDWTEICDGIIHCLNGGLDEKYCSKLEFDQLKNHLDDQQIYSDSKCDKGVPSFRHEEIKCRNVLLTSSCSKTRFSKLFEMVLSTKHHDLSSDCWSAFKCILQSWIESKSYCNDFCVNDQCIKIIEKSCPYMIYISNIPFMFNDIYLAYEKNDSLLLYNGQFHYPYLCYNGSHYDEYFNTMSIPKMLYSNVSCYREIHSLVSPTISINAEHFIYIQNNLLSGMQTANNISSSCTQPNLYQCINSSTCIPIEYLNDYEQDCPYMDDENLTESNDTELLDRLLNICGICAFYENEDMKYIRRHVSFQTICDGYTVLKPWFINGRKETDETECEHWECNNVYTRCNGFWNCLDGADEVNCQVRSTINCSSNEHVCVSPHKNELICVFLTKINDGIIDCLGAMDESAWYRHEYREEFRRFYCKSQNSEIYLSSDNLCDGTIHCDNEDDERICKIPNNCDMNKFLGISFLGVDSAIQSVLCESINIVPKRLFVYFTLGNSSKSDIIGFDNTRSIDLFPSIIPDGTENTRQSQCHRGLVLRTWLDNINRQAVITCLCPSSYYGDQCQYQNQRVSLSLQFRSLSDSIRTSYIIVILLIDDSIERIIHSYQQFTYMSIRDCNTKFNNYLTYSMRPRNVTKNYAIHIDIYEQNSFFYRQSLLFPIVSKILPVHRLSFVIDIPKSESIVKSCNDRRCVHGTCMKYMNNRDHSGFCQCNPGWTGQNCHISFNCTCSSDSLCLGISANRRSICICPMHRFGPRCYIHNTICQTNVGSTCQSGGTCIPFDKYKTRGARFICICPLDFSGDRCEIPDAKIILSFEKNLLPQSMFIHFIRVIAHDKPERITTFKTISFPQDFVIIKWPLPFNVAFIEMGKNNYYLTAVEKTYNQSITINRMIHTSDRCPHINELFNETIINLHLLRRIKYYQKPCRDYHLNLACFYDEAHLCLCYQHEQKILTNCFEFNHSKTFDCSGQNACENGGQCFQDSLVCPSRTMCLCPSCYYGQRCQFTTNGFGLSLDNILGYYIQPNVCILHQTIIVKISIALNIIFMIVGFINGILALITFKNKITREVGCGLYLLGSSITTLLIVFIFGLKFWILIAAQMFFISDEFFLNMQCILLDFFIRICLNMDQWLNACVACERAITIMKGARFNKAKSKEAAKKVIVILCILNIMTSIHDPIYRHLIHEQHNDTDEKRTWCVVTYPPGLQLYNSIMYIFQFLVPFIINFISATILIMKKTYNQSNFRTNEPRIKLLIKNYRQHRHLFIAPVLLVILAIPRVIISFTSKCMKSSNDTWLFLMGYFISFIPPALTFVIFILPSKFYKKQFHKSIVEYQSSMRRRFRLIL